MYKYNIKYCKICNVFGEKKLVTSLLIERQEKSQNLGSIPIALQKLCRKNQAPPSPGANRVKINLVFMISREFVISQVISLGNKTSIADTFKTASLGNTKSVK